jgi:hypothetical protein
MRPVSAAFLAAVGSSHQMASRVRVVAPGQNQLTPTTLQTLAVESGTVTLDSTAQVRGSLSLTVADGWPPSTTSPVTPYGNELFVERGVVFGDGHTEWVSQGYYRINSVEQQSAPSGPLDLTCTDRMQGVVDARLTTPQVFAAGTPVLTVIQALIGAIYPWAVYDYDASLSTTLLASTQTTTDDRFGFLDDLITSYGMVWYWDYRGYLYIHQPPDPLTPVSTVASGQGGVLVSMERQLNRTGVYNGVVASGQDTGAGAVVSALVIDNNPASLTYWYGSFGQIPQFYSSSFITTQAQAVTAGQSLLVQSIGLPYNVDFSSVPNPALEPLDCIQLNYPGRSGESHVLSKVTIPLDAATALTASTRQQYVGVFTS